MTEAAFGRGKSSIFLDDVTCNGDESALLDCSYRGRIGCHNCLHSEDAGVRCQGEKCLFLIQRINCLSVKVFGLETQVSCAENAVRV